MSIPSHVQKLIYSQLYFIQFLNSLTLSDMPQSIYLGEVQVTRTVAAIIDCFHWLAFCIFDSPSCVNTTLLVVMRTSGTLCLLSNRGKVSLV